MEGVSKVTPYPRNNVDHFRFETRTDLRSVDDRKTLSLLSVNDVNSPV